MKIKCPACNRVSELPFEIAEGQHVLCPYCDSKFEYRQMGSCVLRSGMQMTGLRKWLPVVLCGVLMCIIGVGVCLGLRMNRRVDSNIKEQIKSGAHTRNGSPEYMPSCHQNTLGKNKQLDNRSEQKCLTRQDIRRQMNTDWYDKWWWEDIDKLQSAERVDIGGVTHLYGSKDKIYVGRDPRLPKDVISLDRMQKASELGVFGFKWGEMPRLKGLKLPCRVAYAYKGLFSTLILSYDENGLWCVAFNRPQYKLPENKNVAPELRREMLAENIEMMMPLFVSFRDECSQVIGRELPLRWSSDMSSIDATASTEHCIGSLKIDVLPEDTGTISFAIKVKTPK